MIYGMYANPQYLLNIWIYANLSLISFLAVHSLFIKYYKATNQLYFNPVSLLPNIVFNKKNVFIVMLACFSIGLVVLYLYLSGLGFHVALLGLLHHNSNLLV